MSANSCPLEERMLELTMLTVPDCPNEPVLRERLTQALADQPAVTVNLRVIEGEADAARYGMHGSPTLLINGVDPFAAPGTPSSVSCRLYRDESGPTGGAPSVAALRAALQQTVEHPVPSEPATAVGRAGLGRLAPVEGGLRAVHQRVLRAFAETGKAPSKDELDEAAAPFETSSQQVLAQLHAADFLRLDTFGAISAAYPFSPTPTPHLVQITDGPQVFSMCAIDALGIAAMLGKDVTISSAEPGTGNPITVTVPADTSASRVLWNPATTVVFYGRQSTCGTCPPEASADATVPSIAADICCDYINFFTDQDNALAWAQTHPGVTGQVLSQQEAWGIGVHIFGPLLRPHF
ncbi:alkylmercury lyase family protein [Nonomuraea sp. NPDC046570]|uniref:alkylmercury lyase family protein n=1 Tax=Nonomuraea sp. NPDC046570 TaxID=3155255 RepID=UPI0034112AE7